MRILSEAYRTLIVWETLRRMDEDPYLKIPSVIAGKLRAIRQKFTGNAAESELTRQALTDSELEIIQRLIPLPY